MQLPVGLAPASRVALAEGFWSASLACCRLASVMCARGQLGGARSSMARISTYSQISSGDIEATTAPLVAHEADQALGLEALERLAHRDLADMEALGESSCLSSTPLASWPETMASRRVSATKSEVDWRTALGNARRCKARSSPAGEGC